MAITQTITTIPEAGHRGTDIRDDFVTKQEAFQDQLSNNSTGFVVEMNTLAEQIETARGEINTSETNAATSETNAAASETNAGTSETNAATSETNAATSETNAQLREWEAEAWKFTAQSYAQEPHNVFVNFVTSDGDGTFTYTPTTEYSALHWKEEALANSGVNPLDYVAKAGSTMTGNLTVPNLLTAGNVDGRDVSVDGTKLDSIETDANNYTLPSSVVHETEYASSTTGGTIKMRLDGTTLYITNDGTDA